MKALMLLAFSITSLSVVGCSGEKSYDFRVANWGDTMDQVIAAEQAQGNEKPETDVDTDNITIKFSDIVISGQSGEAEYTFVNKIDKPYISQYIYDNDKKGKEIIVELNKDGISESRKEMLSNELNKLEEKYQDEYDNLPESYALDDFRLESANYYFNDMDDEASKRIIDELKKKYGEPIRTVDHFTGWVKNNTTITYDGDSFLRYDSSYEEMKKFTKQNKNKGSETDL